ncbi:hypothetical protein MKQ70_34005 [Chitinophaga sedimenti]|uniref:hypothetical protein n=1 Tax=Chitinophaga sedimenti TaxID=2033606 RepID=UPI002005BC4E|nr:hypothetical protein [Chitinophaga sedimenti]MCK7559692.1 hypothetical protein [Chitinophaga sedimenti]
MIGAANRDKGLLNYYWTWRFKHPNVNDFIRVMEKTSGLQLDWYKMYFVNTTKHIDYALDSMFEKNGSAVIRLRRKGLMPMPVDFQVETKDGRKVMHYIPLDLMFGSKPNEIPSQQRVEHEPWQWVAPTYEINLGVPFRELKSVEIDPSQRMADIDRSNNKAVA